MCTMYYLNDNIHWGILKWSAHSPDMNTIENVWGWMKDNDAEVNPKMIDGFIAFIIDVYIANLANSISERLKTVINTDVNLNAL